MSIIYNTLERLESDNLPLASNKANASSPRLAIESRGFPVKSLATAVMVTVLAAGLMLWYRSAEPGGSQSAVPATAANPSVAAGRLDYQLSPVSSGELPVAALESTESNSETAPEQDAAPVVSTPTETVAIKDEQRVTVKVEPPQIDSIEEPAIAADARADTVSSRVVKAKTAPAEPEQQNQIPSAEAVDPGGVEEVIDQARFALSRGRYQQALSTLEALEPVSEKRADLWLIKGSAHLGAGQLELAETAFASAQALAPDNALITVQQAVLKQEQGDHASALQILKGAAIRYPNVPEVFLNQGYSLQALGAVREARRSFRIFLKLTESRSLYSQQRTVIQDWLAQGSSV